MAERRYPPHAHEKVETAGSGHERPIMRPAPGERLGREGYAEQAPVLRSRRRGRHENDSILPSLDRLLHDGEKVLLASSRDVKARTVKAKLHQSDGRGIARRLGGRTAEERVPAKALICWVKPVANRDNTFRLLADDIAIPGVLGAMTG